MSRKPGKHTEFGAAPDASAHSPFPNLEAFVVSGGGHISIGAAGPVACAAIASDDDIMYAALQRQKDESLVDLLHRLDAALLQAIDNGELTDEING